MSKRILAFFLAVVMVLALPVGAQELEEATPIIEVKISTTEEFMTFAENCRLDNCC